MTNSEEIGITLRAFNSKNLKVKISRITNDPSMIKSQMIIFKI
jgi:hypothetical protein